MREPFEGRFRTNNDMVVAVHRLKVTPLFDAKYWGHEVRESPLDVGDDVYYWDVKGNCIAMEREELGMTRDSLGDFDLVHRLSQSDFGYVTRVDDCLECQMYLRTLKG